MDKERILAARKKLKEFQRNKKDYHKEYEKAHIERKSSQDESTKLDATISRNDNTILENVSGHINYFNNGSNVDAFSEMLKNETPISESNNINYESKHSDFQKDDMSHQHNSMEEMAAESNESTIINDSSISSNNQLQMASAITDAVVNNEEPNESSSALTIQLEQKNYLLSTCNEEQRKLIIQLQTEVGQYSSKVSELEALLAGHEAQFEARLASEVGQLQEQLQVQVHTTGILVTEKTELMSSLSQMQSVCKQKSDEVAELSSRLKASQYRVSELEKELTALKKSSNESENAIRRIQQSYDEMANKFSELQKEKEDIEFDSSEIRQALSMKTEDLTKLQQQLQEKTSLLSLSELRIQQLTNSPQDLQDLENQHQTNVAMEQQIAQLKDALKSLNGEKEDAAKQYQNYIHQMDDRYNKLSIELETTKKLYTESQDREQSYIQRLSDMEQLLQRERERADDMQPAVDQKEQIELLTKNIENLVAEQENFQKNIETKDAEIELLKRDLQELEDMREETIEASKLATALQGEQLGASRAVAQNQQLKQQLNEMHDAFVLLSNSKLDLTEQLQAERSIGKKLNAHLNTVEQRMDKLVEELSKKDSALQDLEKEKLQVSQVADQVQHYQAQSHNAHTIQDGLQNALITIERLKMENQQLLSTLNELREAKVVETTINGEVENVEGDSNFIQPLENKDHEQPNLLEPFRKLEIKFKDAMEKVAELSDEKQRLEHLVLQLQGETETIGEYITLYQSQRAILQMKTHEREKMFCELLEERNVQQAHLHKLKILVTELLNAKHQTVCTSTVAEERSPLTNHAEVSEGEKVVEVIEGQSCTTKDGFDLKGETTSQILDLLSDIKDCNNLDALGSDFHHCPWCSGKLINV